MDLQQYLKKNNKSGIAFRPYTTTENEITFVIVSNGDIKYLKHCPWKDDCAKKHDVTVVCSPHFDKWVRKFTQKIKKEFPDIYEMTSKRLCFTTHTGSGINDHKYMFVDDFDVMDASFRMRHNVLSTIFLAANDPAFDKKSSVHVRDWRTIHQHPKKEANQACKNEPVKALGIVMRLWDNIGTQDFYVEGNRIK